MRRIALVLAGLLFGSLFLAGCDKCGEPIRFNVPSLPNACYDAPKEK